MGEPVSAVSLLNLFVTAAGAFGKLTDWLLTRRGKERHQIAEYFLQISACLREVAERMEAGEAPHDTCRRLAVYADELQGILGDRLTAAGDASADQTRLRLASRLEQARFAWLESLPSAEDSRNARNITELLVKTSALGSSAEPSQATVDRLESEVSTRTGDHTYNSVQLVWDAAGEFAALADTLRAR